MKITHQGDLSIFDLDSDELGRAIRAYVRDHLPAEEHAALTLPDLRPLRYAEVGLLGDVYVSGQRIDMCGARVVARRQVTSRADPRLARQPRRARLRGLARTLATRKRSSRRGPRGVTPWS